MYLEHFGLNEYPFQLTPNTAYFYSRAGHREALDILGAALATGEGFIRVTGEVGTGKTLLCRLLLRELGDEWVRAMIPNPALDPESLRQVVADEFGVSIPPGVNAHAVLARLHERLIQIAKAGQRSVLVIDEAQVMADESLEMVRLLTNLETERAKLLHVVLIGQPELDRRLAEPHLRQLRQRCTFRYELGTLPRKQVDDYIHHRLQTAGYRGRSPFAPAAVRRLARAAQGVPRTLNTLAHKSLLAAYAEGVAVVEKRHVDRAIADTETAYVGWLGRWMRRARGAAG